MQSPFKYSDTNKRYRTQSSYLKQRFGCKVMKISLNCGFTCPNIDGTKGVGGCTYCSAGSGEFAGDCALSVTEQFEQVRAKMNMKWHEGLYIPYFQANTNTYGPLEKIRTMVEEALTLENVCGIAISTRPDCITPEILQRLQQFHVTAIELGAQSMQDAVLQKNHRGHTAQDVRNAAKWITAAGFSLGLQMMIGLDGSTPEQERETLQELLALHPDTLRIYPLVVLKGTELAERVQNGSFVLYDWETVLELCADALCACRQQGVRVIRCGLHAEDTVQSEAVAGFYHPALSLIHI